MSWDISIQDLPSEASTVTDIPDTFAPMPLGPRSSLIHRILEVAPSADFTDPAWGVLTTPDFVIEFNMGNEEVADAIMLHVHGSVGASDFVVALLHHLNLRAIDCSEGDFVDESTSAASFERWKQYRDRVTSN